MTQASSSCFDGESGAAGLLLNNLIQQLPGIPESVARDKIAQALRDFAQRSALWTFEQYEQELCPGDTVLEFPKEDGVEVAKVLDVYIQHCDCEEVLPKLGVFKAVCGCADGQGWKEPLPGKVVFNQDWDCCQNVRFALQLKPAAGSDTFPPALLEQHQNVIEQGALAKAYLIPKQEWSSTELGIAYSTAFERELQRLEEEARLLRHFDLRADRPTYCPTRRLLCCH
ncbi:hypothetical protein [Thiolinea disciformis]|uniref:hypothetical protein n=1 Tax=Thiolinea disciformis TaxID=125614 RepID=UPI00035C90D5|nr:hypothetical protein [Thiolinea disciformis]